MKPIIQILTLILLLTQTALATTLTVKQDSTGDYTIIQDAVNTSTDGDTVMVWPGTYYENVNFSGKNITLASLMLTTGDESYRQNAIIDGNENGSCVAIVSGESDALLYGFTLQNGTGFECYSNLFFGGGLALFQSIAEINNCIIINNSANHGGGGVYINESVAKIRNCSIKHNFTKVSGGGMQISYNSNVWLSYTSIISNQAMAVGGGIVISNNNKMLFDTINKCNIYLNYASRGCEIQITDIDSPIEVVVDTCTVLNPDSYFISSTDDLGNLSDDVTFSGLHAKITPADTDLYVNPLTGDNNNSGLTPEDPLQSIAFAYSKIIVDSMENNTIHLADGVYSDSANNEKFPLNLRPYINLVGESMEKTIFDGRYKTMFIKGNNGVSNYNISKLTMKRGNQPEYYDIMLKSYGFGSLYWENENISLDSIIFTDAASQPANPGLYLYRSKNSRISNCTFNHYKGEAALRINLQTDNDTTRIHNCHFFDIKPDTNNPEYDYGRALVVGTGYDEKGMAIITNTLFDNNDRNAMMIAGCKTYAVNCTFTNNALLQQPAVSVWVNSGDLRLYNCIAYNNGLEIPFYINSLDEKEGNFYVQHSLIDGGQESITLGGEAYLFYDEATNIDTDPFFLDKWEHPYQIADGSPCIDAGTLAKLPDFIELPETDLAGNPRIVGDSIDMGAYEWNPTVGIDKYLYQPIKNEKPRLLHAAPNPFSWETTISAQWDFTGHVQIEIYNNAGLRVKVLKSGRSGGKGSINAKWDGKDQNGNLLPAGIYHVVMFWEGKEVEGMKVVKR